MAALTSPAPHPSPERDPFVLRTPAELSAWCERARREGSRVGLVPTMGALHEGHLRLIDEARQRASAVVVTIFVNPTQFGPNEDLSRYPRTLEADVAACRDRGASVVFTPDAQAMYPAGDEARVRVGATASPLCGAHRPGHFEGVATVVAKLFALVGPCVAVFGRKDFQQVRVIERMATDLFFPVEIVAMPTVREPDGLALSSRNRYLSEPERARALAIVRALSLAARAHAKGERSRDALLALAKSELAPNATSIDYVELADPRTLAPVLPGQMVGDRVLFAVAARVGSTRLIDNLVLGEEEPPIGAPHP